MKNRIIAVLGILMLIIASLPVSNALAYADIYQGEYVNPTHDGLRAIISTGASNGSPPNFSFSAMSPSDIYWQEWDFYVNPSYSCAEAGTTYFRQYGQATSGNFYVSNQCTHTNVYAVNIADSTFRSKYVRQNSWNDTGTGFTDENYDLRIIKLTSTPTWGVYLYNYNTSTYDWIVTVSGSTGYDNGGVWFRDYGGTQQETTPYCPTLYAWNIFQFRGIQYRVGTTWTTVSSSDVSYYSGTMHCFTNNTYKLRTTNAWQFKLEPYGASY